MKSKFFLSFAMVLISVTTFAQQKNQDPPETLYTNESGSYYLDTVFTVEGVSEEELYKRFKNWYISNVRSTSSNSAILDDKELMISDDLTLPLDKFPGARINFKFIAKFKDNKFKIDFKSFQYMYIGGGTLYESAFEEIKVMGKKRVRKAFDEKFEDLLLSIGNHMNKSPEKKKDDW